MRNRQIHQSHYGMNARQRVGVQGSDVGGPADGRAGSPVGGGAPVPVRGYGMGTPSAQAVPSYPPAYGQHYIPTNAVYGQPQPQSQPQPQLQQQPQASGYMAPATSIPQHMGKPKRHKRTGLIIAIVVAIICAGLAVALVLTGGGTGKGARSGSVGQLEGKTHEEIQAELDRIVEEGMFNISIASTVELPNGTSPADLRIENVPGNRYLMRVVITDDRSGQTLYTTDLIEPNHHIQQDTLDVDLDAGTYECTATFVAYDQQTEEEVGQAAAKMTIRVDG